MTGSSIRHVFSARRHDDVPDRATSDATSNVKSMSFASAGTRWGFMQSRMYGRIGTACVSMLRMPADNFTI